MHGPGKETMHTNDHTCMQAHLTQLGPRLAHCLDNANVMLIVVVRAFAVVEPCLIACGHPRVCP